MHWLHYPSTIHMDCPRCGHSLQHGLVALGLFCERKYIQICPMARLKNGPSPHACGDTFSCTWLPTLPNFAKKTTPYYLPTYALFCYDVNDNGANCLWKIWYFFSVYLWNHLKNQYTLQQNVSLYTKWLHWILNELIGPNEQDLMGMQWIHWFSELGLMNCTHIL
jgi:hypothetical protein